MTTAYNPMGTQHSRNTLHAGGDQRPRRNPHNAGTSQVVQRQRPRSPELPTLSSYSSLAVPNSRWFASDFMVGAGMVILQPSTHRVVLLRELGSHRWFLPKGRKDVGESLEQTALREAYEESGYRAEFLPLYTPTNAPQPPDVRHSWMPNTEPIFISTMTWGPRRQRPGRATRAGDRGGEYLTFWYVGQIPDDAIPQFDANMPDEETYVTHLMSIGDAVRVLQEDRAELQLWVVQIAWNLWVESMNIEAEIEARLEATTRARSSSDSGSLPLPASSSRGSSRGGQGTPPESPVSAGSS